MTPVGWRGYSGVPRAAETSDGSPRDLAVSRVDGCARRVGASGGGLRLRDGPESGSVWWVAEVEACPSRPPTSQDKPSRAAGGGEGRSSAGSSTITTVGGPAPHRVGRRRTGWPGQRCFRKMTRQPCPGVFSVLLRSDRTARRPAPYPSGLVALPSQGFAARCSDRHLHDQRPAAIEFLGTGGVLMGARHTADGHRRSVTSARWPADP
jgi:hypothetical protein